jgi:hypothetical protein
VAIAERARAALPASFTLHPPLKRDIEYIVFGRARISARILPQMQLADLLQMWHICLP